MTTAPVLQHPVQIHHKLVPPLERKAAVLREALCEQICESSQAQLFLAYAPAGFGKTTLLGQCRARLQAQGVRTAWLTLDAQDNDLARLLVGLQAVLEQIDPHAHRAIASANKDAGVQVIQLIDRMSTITSRFALFIDDAEALVDAATLACLTDMVERLPQVGQIFMGSRTQPQLPLARLRARGQLMEIDAADLRFSLEETTQFLSRLPLHLSAKALEQLHQRTEGWAAALWLASLALERATHESGTRFIDNYSGSHTSLADYLAQEVLLRLPPDLKVFLLRTSILKTLDPDLCQELLPSADAARQLHRLTMANIFVAPVAGEPGIYRYHPLFSSFLRAQLHREAPLAAALLHRTASRWYWKRGKSIPAIDHGIESGDVARTIEMLSTCSMAFLTAGRLRLLARWFSQLPLESLNDSPMLQIVRLWTLTLTSGPVDGVEQLAASHLEGNPDATVQIHVMALKVTLFAMHDQHALAYTAGQQLLEKLPSGEHFAEAVAQAVMADTAAVLGRHEEARQLIDAARRTDVQGDNTLSQLHSESIEGIIDLFSGRQREAAARFRLAAGVLPTGSRSSTNGNAWAGLLYAATEYEQNHLENASRLLHLFVPMVCSAGLIDHMILGHIMQSRIAFARRDTELGLLRIAELEALGHKRQLPRVIASARLERARIAMHQGDLRGADFELSRPEDPALWQRIARQCHLANDLEDLSLSQLRRQVLFADASGARADIEKAITEASEHSRFRRALLLELLLAMSALRCGDTIAAISQAEKVIQTCARNGMVRLLIDEGPTVRILLERLALQESMSQESAPLLHRYLQHVLSAFDPEEATPVPPPMTDILTRQERRVLENVAEGLSNESVATRMGISASTARTHLRNINAKLQARNRTEAVTIARRIGALSQ